MRIYKELSHNGGLGDDFVVELDGRDETPLRNNISAGVQLSDGRTR
jgi:hypothetical protein